jgi:hypothetical protein
LWFCATSADRLASHSAERTEDSRRAATQTPQARTLWPSQNTKKQGLTLWPLMTLWPLRNGIANLWWYGYLTYDENRQNPYELTEILLKKLDIARNIQERNLGRNKTLLQSFLEFLAENPEINESGNKGREIIRILVRQLNCHGGVCVLDTLNGIEIKAVLKESLLQIEVD